MSYSGLTSCTPKPISLILLDSFVHHSSSLSTYFSTSFQLQSVEGKAKFQGIIYLMRYFDTFYLFQWIPVIEDIMASPFLTKSKDGRFRIISTEAVVVLLSASEACRLLYHPCTPERVLRAIFWFTLSHQTTATQMDIHTFFS